MFSRALFWNLSKFSNKTCPILPINPFITKPTTTIAKTLFALTKKSLNPSHKCIIPSYISMNSRQISKVTGNIVSPVKTSGMDYLSDGRLNKGLAFTLEERQALGIHGLLPALFQTQEEQIKAIKISVDRYTSPLNKYLYLADLQDRNERLFYRFVSENIDEMMPIICTPTVGHVCKRFGLLHRKPRGLFITINDRGHIFDILKNWPEPNVRAIAVTDGERILSLGDLGAHGMGIPIGKMSLYTALAGVPPHQCLPILLDAGTNNQDLLEDPMYLGLRQQRTSGPVYDAFVDEFMEAVVKRYGQNTLIHFENMIYDNAFKCLDRYRNSYCCFNNDIQGMGACVVSGLMAAKRLTGKSFKDYKYLFVGANEMAVGIAHMITRKIINEQRTRKEAENSIWMFDIHGLVTTKRDEGFDKFKAMYAKDHEPTNSIEEIVKEIKPTVLIGATGKRDVLTPTILKLMAKNADRPIVFAMSSPNENSDCTPQAAYEHTNGRVIYGSGSPFPPVKYQNMDYQTGQIKSAHIFPGVALGVILTGAYRVSDDLFIIAAKELANAVTNSDLERGSIFPKPKSVIEVTLRIAEAVTNYAYKNGVATYYPEPRDKQKWIKSNLYNYNYESNVPKTWVWPTPPVVKMRAINPSLWYEGDKSKEVKAKQKKAAIKSKC